MIAIKSESTPPYFGFCLQNLLLIDPTCASATIVILACWILDFLRFMFLISARTRGSLTICFHDKERFSSSVIYSRALCWSNRGLQRSTFHVEAQRFINSVILLFWLQWVLFRGWFGVWLEGIEILTTHEFITNTIERTKLKYLLAFWHLWGYFMGSLAPVVKLITRWGI